jgi:hypothetical protein
LQNCRPADVPRRAERILSAVTASSKDEFIAVPQARMSLMTPAQAAWLKKVIRQAEAVFWDGQGVVARSQEID